MGILTQFENLKKKALAAPLVLLSTEGGAGITLNTAPLLDLPHCQLLSTALELQGTVLTFRDTRLPSPIEKKKKRFGWDLST